jgi:hypothetical protein
MAEGDPSRFIGPNSVRIRAPMSHAIGHRTRQLACIVVAEAASEIKEACYAAHLLTLVLRRRAV